MDRHKLQKPDINVRQSCRFDKLIFIIIHMTKMDSLLLTKTFFSKVVT